MSTFNLTNVICQAYLNKAGKEREKGPLPHLGGGSKESLLGGGDA